LAAFANEQGGHDNISVALARIGASAEAGLATSDPQETQET